MRLCTLHLMSWRDIFLQLSLVAALGNRAEGGAPRREISGKRGAGQNLYLACNYLHDVVIPWYQKSMWRLRWTGLCLMISRHPGDLIKQTIECPLTSQSLPYCCSGSLSFLILLTSYHQWDRKLHSSRKICQVRAFEWTLVLVFDCLSLVFSYWQ